MLRSSRNKEHRPSPSIAAHARSLRLTLVTRNTKDFPADMPGVRVPYQL